ncbi:MAG: M56 family metallopeptidase [Dissulfurispiraceae bacterium]
MKILWDVNELIASYWGMYAVQIVLHSLIASALVNCIFIACNIRTPYVKQWFRLMIIILPVVSFPIYQLIFPRRGDVYFRLESLLDSNKWFFLDIGKGIPAITLFVIVPAVTTIVFVIQELVPIVFQMLEQVRGGSESGAEAVEEAMALKVSKALEDLPFDEQSIEIVKEDDLMLFSSTGMNPRIYISTGLIKSFSTEHLEVSFAHEIGHIRRNRRPVLILAYILRVLMFFNPVAMIEFRRLVQEEENVCDDMAVALTGKPQALSEAIEMLRPSLEDYNLDKGRKGVRGIVAALEHYSHDLLMKSRVLRIGEPNNDGSYWGVAFCLTQALIISINYFIV